VIGGGETVAVVTLAGAADQIDHVSTGGGASLELLAGEKLPGVEVVRER
jgi:phosphoglycerate kinase